MICKLIILLVFFIQEKNPIESIDSAIASLNIIESKKLIDKHFDSEDFELLWRASRVYTLAGDASRSNEVKEELYQKAAEYSEKAIKINSSRPEGFIRKAIALGKIALHKGVFEVGGIVNDSKKNSEKALAISESISDNYHASLAYYVLGRAHLKLSERADILRAIIGLGWANIEDAIEYLSKAVSLRSDFILYRIDYARALILKGEKTEAIKQLETIQKITVKEMGDEDRIEESKKMLEELK